MSIEESPDVITRLLPIHRIAKIEGCPDPIHDSQSSHLSGM